ncbi:MAG: glutamine--tRNA ligase/YqeY domain fusion protein [Candidatus Heimdallarchaeota archaeon]|nr:glutamine--tRNA ligase/YqeY domain fusion protein [Candidatus Heimdallarchaeota archaeon]
MGLVFKADSELRKDAKRIKEIIENKVDYINSLTAEEIQQLAQKQFPELLQKKEKEVQEEADFIREIIEEHNRTGRFDGKVHTRFPPEPNGWLHIGHAYSINRNYNFAFEYRGKFNLRFDDTNPLTEEEEFVESIIKDVLWLGVDYEDRLLFASDYFDQLYEYAVQLVRKGLAYVDDSSVEEIREMRGTITEHGQESPYRNRPIEENLDLFERMKNGEFKNGEKVLRAKIDMSHPNMLMRDPIIYRILHASHHRTGDKWCIYPMYDWAHGLEDSIEGITHSNCTLEFEVHRPLYDWYIDQLEDEEGNPIHHSQQTEFAKMNLSYMVLSKRNMRMLVEGGYVNGWDDPRMLTIAGMRRRGYTPEAIRNFSLAINFTKREKLIDMSILEHYIREDLDKRCPRVMSVLNPLKLVITNYPEDKEEVFSVPNHPSDKSMGTREVKFTRNLFIEKEDFMEDPPDDYYRLSPGKEVRLKYAYFIKYEDTIKDEITGEIKEIHCTYDSETKGGESPDGRKVQGTIHWLSADNALKVEVRQYDRLYTKENPMDTEEGKEFKDYLNPDSINIIESYVEPFLKEKESGSRSQFERNGYYVIDIEDSSKENLVFNRIITLRDSWGKK